MSTLSILGLYKHNPQIFDKFAVPDEIDKDLVTNNLLLELAELELLYPNWDIMYDSIGFWSQKELPVWKKLAATINLEYNPIWNTDRTEEYVENVGTDIVRNVVEQHDGSTDTSVMGNDSETSSSNTDGSTSRDVISEASGNTLETQRVAAFNEENFSPSAQNNTDTHTDTSGLENEKNDVKVTGNNEISRVSDTNQKNEQKINRDDTESNTQERSHSLRAFGNIGVTTTQNMINQERQVALFNLADVIIDSFKNRFCILVW